LRVAEDAPIAYLTQTTLATDETAEVIAALHSRFPTLEGPKADDICYATQNRQDAVRGLAGECDVIGVVGSANSSNSNRLVEVATRAGCPSYLVEDETALDMSWFAGAATIGVTAGASAPELFVQGVVDALGALGPCDVIEREFATEAVRFTLPPEVR
ncbi:MAG: 4-hydroxy-3-methylbut-2-enyl diphosphate reductase, partial [Acidimicrobiales bacterium]